MVSKIQVAGFSGIICISGDGLIHEVINGLMKRHDWENAIQIPVGTIPAGSGNALAAELGIIDPIAAAFAIAKGRTRSLDLLQVSQEGQADIYSFLSINWGMISDVDFESEKYRFVGAARFTLGALVRITNLRNYPGIIEYIPAKPRSDGSQFCTRDDTCSFCKNNNNNNRNNSLRISLDKNDHQNEDNDESNGIKLNEEPEIENDHHHHHEDDHNNIFESEDWQILESKFVTVVACNISKLSSDLIAAPYAHLADNCIDLLIVEKCSRSELVSLFTEMETGEFINHATFNAHSFVKYLKVKQLKITQNGKQKCIFGLDGEKVPSKNPLSVVNRHALATIVG